MATIESEARARLSWMWVFVVLSMIFADILSFMSPDFLGQVLAGRAGGIKITPEFLLLAAVVTAIPIAMVVLSQRLPTRATRWANVIAGAATILYVWGGGALTLPHYVFFAGLETLGCLAIVWWAWRWRQPGGNVTMPDVAG